MNAPNDATSWSLTIFLALAIVLAPGCASSTGEPSMEGDIPVYVVTHGWHTGLAMRAADIDFARWRPLPHPGGARYLEVGWGDRDYYPAPRFNLWYGFKALAWPTPGALQVTGFDEPPARYFPASEVVELGLDRRRFERLLAYIAASFGPGAAPIAPSLYATGAFYPSREKFHLFKTCNVWVARALRAAGIEVRSSIATEGLMAQLRAYHRARAD